MDFNDKNLGESFACGAWIRISTFNSLTRKYIFQQSEHHKFGYAPKLEWDIQVWMKIQQNFYERLITKGSSEIWEDIFLRLFVKK